MPVRVPEGILIRVSLEVVLAYMSVHALDTALQYITESTCFKGIGVIVISLLFAKSVI